MNITIVGAGNMGLAMLAYVLLNKKVRVKLFTSKSVFGSAPFILNEVDEAVVTAVPKCEVAADPSIAFGKADVVFVTYPAFLRKHFIECYGCYFKPGTYVGFVPGYGGAEYFCEMLLKRGITIFGFQRVPYVARAVWNNDATTVNILARKSRLFICAIPNCETRKISEIVECLLDISVQPTREYLPITLAPSNPLLHVTGLYNVFKNFEKGMFFDRPLKFYEEWNDEASELLFQYDNELQDICKALAPLDMSEVVPLPVYYEAPSPALMTKKLKSIKAFETVFVPLKQEGTSYVPDLSSRMFVEDFPFGVCLIKDFALMAGVKTPTVDLMLDFYKRLSGHEYFSGPNYTKEIEHTGVPGVNGIKTVKDILSFYHR